MLSCISLIALDSALNLTKESTKNDAQIKMSCKACEELPLVSAEYTEKGKYETIDGLKTCK